MGHAPVILPAVAGMKLHFGFWFCLPLLALQASLLLRLAGGIGHPALRALGALGALGAELNAATLALSAATALGSAIAWRLRKAA